MGVTIAKGATFLGVPLTKVRNVLKAWHAGNRSDLWRIAERRDVELDPRTVMVLIDELRDRGLIGPEEQEDGRLVDGLTQTGLALAGADARKRTPKPRAAEVLDRFLDACSAVNARTDVPLEIERVWLFGSMLDADRSDVADIDLVVEENRRGAYPDWDTAQQRFEELGREMGAPRMQGLMSIIGDQVFVMRQLLHGGRRHPLLAMNGLEELRDMACPCQLIFDASRGGRVTDPVLERHPASKGRSNRIAEKRRMPDFTEGRQPLRPLPLSLMTTQHFYPSILRRTGVWPSDDNRYWIASNYVTEVAIIAEGARKATYETNALTKRMRFTGCDGRARGGLVLIQSSARVPGDWSAGFRRRAMAGIGLTRTFDQQGPRVRYTLDVTEADHLGQRIDYPHALALQWWIDLVVTADVERILRREDETGSSFDLSVEIGMSPKAAAMIELDGVSTIRSRAFVEVTRERLGQREVGVGLMRATG